MRTGACERCGEAFVDTSHRQHRQFCSDNCRKRHYEETTGRKRCAQCGGPMTECSARRGYKRCKACHRRDAVERCARLVELRREGLTNREIAAREAINELHVGRLIWVAKNEYGMEVPPPPYWSRGKAAA